MEGVQDVGVVAEEGDREDGGGGGLELQGQELFTPLFDLLDQDDADLAEVAEELAVSVQQTTVLNVLRRVTIDLSLQLAYAIIACSDRPRNVIIITFLRPHQ